SMDAASRTLHRKIHQTIHKFSTDIENDFHFNTCISSVMELMNTLSAHGGEAAREKAHPAVVRCAIETIITLLYPMVPHICAELWQMIGHREALDTQSWPVSDPEAAKEDELTIVVQICGKVRSRLQVPVGTGEEQLKSLAMADDRVLKFVDGKPIRKVIVVKDKLVNIVV
ncbi:MAG: class I tRNA ligase family protein, partial [Desulfobulbaceae bacterium]|nr:class I tRNA ligase family protein [Desulfobulbaceae bacterium]